jgi:lia operon protein LiaG
MKKAVFILFIIMVVSFTLAGITFKVTGAASPTPYSLVEVNEEQELALDAVREIRLKTVEYDIHVIPVDDDRVRLHFHGKVRPKGKQSPWIETRKRAGRLEVRIVDSPDRVRLNIIRINHHLNQTGSLDVYLPQDYREKLKTDSVSGSLQLTGFKVAELNCHSISGDITLESFESEQARVETVSGELVLRECSGTFNLKTVSGEVANRSFSGQVKMKTVSGDIVTAVDNGTFVMNMETTSGNIQISIPKDAKCGLGFETISGNYQSDIPVQLTKAGGKGRLEGTMGDSNSGNRIEVRSMSGNLRIRETE